MKNIVVLGCATFRNIICFVVDYGLFEEFAEIGGIRILNFLDYGDLEFLPEIGFWRELTNL